MNDGPSRLAGLGNETAGVPETLSRSPNTSRVRDRWNSGC